jgi:hypothetical protein
VDSGADFIEFFLGLLLFLQIPGLLLASLEMLQFFRLAQGETQGLLLFLEDPGGRFELLEKAGPLKLEPQEERSGLLQ